MGTGRREPDAVARARPAGASAVHVGLSGGRLELRLVRFDRKDLAAIKAIPGRRWHPEARVWTLPQTTECIEALRDRFGARLRWSNELPTRRPEDGLEASPRPRLESRETWDDAEAFILDALRRAIRTRAYSLKTEKAYLGWSRRFLAFHRHSIDHPQKLARAHVTGFLEHLAIGARLSPGSRNQAASALAFMFREAMGRDELAGVPRAKGPKRLPVVLSHREVLTVLGELKGKHFLIVVLLYSAGLRLDECLGLRVKDIDFDLRQILVRDGKGRKDRYVPLAERAVALARAQLGRISDLRKKDLATGQGWAPLPGALHRKDPAAGYELGWQFVFPATTIHTDPGTGRAGRWPLHPTAVQRAVKRAVRRSGVTKRATCHTFRHSFATEALRSGWDIRTLQNVMGHKDIRTTMIYLHVLEQTGLAMRSPLDRPELDALTGDHHDSAHVSSARPGMEWILAERQWGPPDG